MRYPEHNVLFFFGYLFRMGVSDQGQGIDMYKAVYMQVCPGIYAKKSKLHSSAKRSDSNRRPLAF